MAIIFLIKVKHMTFTVRKKSELKWKNWDRDWKIIWGHIWFLEKTTLGMDEERRYEGQFNIRKFVTIPPRIAQKYFYWLLLLSSSSFLGLWVFLASDIYCSLSSSTSSHFCSFFGIVLFGIGAFFYKIFFTINSLNIGKHATSSAVAHVWCHRVFYCLFKRPLWLCKLTRWLSAVDRSMRGPT